MWGMKYYVNMCMLFVMVVNGIFYNLFKSNCIKGGWCNFRVEYFLMFVNYLGI